MAGGITTRTIAMGQPFGKDGWIVYSLERLIPWGWNVFFALVPLILKWILSPDKSETIDAINASVVREQLFFVLAVSAVAGVDLQFSDKNVRWFRVASNSIMGVLGMIGLLSAIFYGALIGSTRNLEDITNVVHWLLWSAISLGTIGELCLGGNVRK